MNEDKSKIIRMVQKLFKVADGNANENESALAACKARDIMMKYGLDTADVKEKIEMFEIEKIGRFYASTWRKRLGYMVAKHYMCYSVIRTFHHEHFMKTGKKRQGITFVGREMNAELSAYAFEIINKQIWLMEDRKYRELKNAGHPSVKTEINGYVLGILETIENMFESQRGYQTSNETALVNLYESELMEYKETKKYGKSKRGGVKYSSGIMSEGREDGKKIRITPAVGSKGSTSKVRFLT